MRRKLVVPLLLLALFSVACAKHASAPVPGSINTFDAEAFRTLADTQAAIDSVKADIVSGRIVLSPEQKVILNQAIADYNVAEASFQAYHSGATNDTAGLTQAINQLVADIAAIATKIQGVKQ